MDIGTYVRGILDKASGKSNSPDYRDTMDKINEIISQGERLPEREKIDGKTYERLEYDAPTDEEIKDSATVSLEEYRKSGIAGIENEIKALIDKYGADKSSSDEAYQKTIKSLTEAYDSAIETAKNDALKRGLARSSIASSTVASIEGERAKSVSATAKEYAKKIEQIDAEISALEAKKQKAMDDFNVSYTVKLTEKIDELRNEREERKAETLKYNNSLTQKENDEEIERKKAESDLYTEALEHKKAEKTLLDKPSQFVLDQEYAKIFDILHEKLSSLDAITAQKEVKENPIYRNYLSEEYYYRLYDEFGR